MAFITVPLLSITQLMQAKVRHLQRPSASDQHIGGLQVTMHLHCILMHVDQTLQSSNIVFNV